MTDPKTIAAINKTIGQKVKRTMEARGFTRATLSAEIGMTETRLARIIKGSSEMTAPELVIAARKLCVPIQSLTF